MLLVIGLFFSIFLTTLLIFKHGKTTADIILLCWMILIALHTLLSLGLQSGFTFDYPHTLGLAFPLPLLHGVFLFFYTRSVTGNRNVKFVKVWPHVIPAVATVLLAIPFYALSALEKVYVFQHEGKGFEWFQQIYVPLIVVTGLAYSIISVYTIHKHRKNILQHFSNTDHKMFRWLESLSIGLGIIWLGVIFFDDYIVFSGVSMFVVFIGFMGINHVPVFYPAFGGATSEEPVIKKALENPGHFQEEATRPQSKLVPEERLRAVLNDLELYMQTKEVYKEPDLTLGQLAEKINVSPNLLSQVINALTGKTYYQYINDYRIDSFINLAQRGELQKVTITALAYDCGFKSKTTFNKHFKLKTGKTPTEYFKEVSPIT